MRTFGLNSKEFYKAVTPPPEPHVWAGGLPREPRRLRRVEEMSVSADDEAAAEDAVREWVERVEAGRAKQSVHEPLGIDQLW